MDDNVSVLNSELLEMAGGLPNRERLLDGLDANTCTLASITAAYKAHKSKITTDFEKRMKTAIDKVTKELPGPLAFRSFARFPGPLARFPFVWYLNRTVRKTTS